jgi:NADPH-dependent 2,4-dienoyl-CoA reductase/sulfur reductase-like enzyme
VKVFDLVAARTGLRDHEARSAKHGWDPVTATTTADDHKAYYPGATPITLAVTGDHTTGRLLGAQLIGRLGAEISKRVDTYAAALFNEMTVDQISDLDLSYTPPLGSPWDAVQIATQAWTATQTAAEPVPPQQSST